MFHLPPSSKLALSIFLTLQLLAQNTYWVPLSVPPSFYGLQWETNSFNKSNAVLSAGIMAAIKMGKARVAVLNGQLRPMGSYTVSPSVTAQVENKMLQYIVDPGATVNQQMKLQEIHAGYNAYLSDARSLNESPDNFVTACAYFAATSLQIEHDRPLTPPERRAVRGNCVAVLGARQQALGQFVVEADRQYAAQSIATIAAVASHQYTTAPRQERPAIKANVEKGFHQFFGSTLSEIPLDHLSCAGAKSQSDFKICNQVPNERFIAVADNAR